MAAISGSIGPRTGISGNGETSLIGRGSGERDTNMDTMRWVRVVPHLGKVAMKMSSARGR